MPIHIINTETGLICDAEAVEAQFTTSPAYARLSEQEGLDHSEMQDVIQTYFSFAMLSHRWGRLEPTYQDIKNGGISDRPSPGATKLHKFCLLAREQGFLWAWSDTCCIDKSSTAELQESIVSMFTWYRNSALTLIYLFDVLDDSEQSLRGSAWFTRGWTLQELLAPKTVQFFKADWTPLSVCGRYHHNYKDCTDCVGLLASITGIQENFIVWFEPGTKNVKERMSWAAHRKTTKPEDISYCLLGIFDVQMPVMYGEREKAFVRLQESIMKKSTDPSLFDWVGKPCSENSFLASSPYCFRLRQPGALACPSQMRISESCTEVTADLRRQHFHLTMYNVIKAVGPNASHPANYIAGSKLQTHGLLYPVKHVSETNASGSQEPEFLCKTHQYDMYVESMDAIPSVTVTTVLRLRTGDHHPELRLLPGSYAIFRPWSDDLGDLFDEGRNHPLVQPFVGQLLCSIPGGRYRRIHTTEPIMVHPPQYLSFWSTWFHTKTIIVE
ncbi:HET-domain-containing protein [Gyrodon lividus]|nr:HET-domain-containing protein [Gyrodon lividus]